jgi:hypothetical protein
MRLPLKRNAAILVAVLGSCFSAVAQTASAATPAATPEAQLQVCCRSLTKWGSSRNPVLRGLNITIVSRLHHCYVDFPAGVIVPGFGAPVQTAGIHPLEANNINKQPNLDQSADNSDRGGYCKPVKDATPEKIKLLAKEIAGGICNACAENYRNRALRNCFNNSNTYVYDLISGAGMTPPQMKGAPGFRAHHDCGQGSIASSHGSKGAKP